jgi:hypothetical protein
MKALMSWKPNCTYTHTRTKFKTIKKLTFATKGNPMDHFFNQLAKDLVQSANRRSLLLLAGCSWPRRLLCKPNPITWFGSRMGWSP